MDFDKLKWLSCPRCGGENELDARCCSYCFHTLPDKEDTTDD